MLFFVFFYAFPFPLAIGFRLFLFFYFMDIFFIHIVKPLAFACTQFYILVIACFLLEILDLELSFTR